MTADRRVERNLKEDWRKVLHVYSNADAWALYLTMRRVAEEYSSRRISLDEAITRSVVKENDTTAIALNLLCYHRGFVELMDDLGRLYVDDRPRFMAAIEKAKEKKS